MKGLERLAVIRKQSENKDYNWIHRDIFRLLKKDDLWLTAYETRKKRIKNWNVHSFRVTFNFDLYNLISLKEKVINESYVPFFKEQYRINDTFDYMKISSFENDIVEEILIMILEAVFEPLFKKTSFGFRPYLGPHDALSYIEKSFRSSDFVIQQEVQYEFINKNVLCDIIRKKIDDVRFINLIRKFLNAGLLIKSNTFVHSLFEMQCGSFLSYVLINIYFHELDIWIENKVKESFNKYQSTNVAKKSHITSYLRYSNLKERLHIRKNHNWTEINEFNVKPINYLRYLNKWLVGIEGDKEFVVQIQKEIFIFLKNSLYLSIVSSESISLNNRAVFFLGYEIGLSKINSLYLDNSYNYKKLKFSLPIKNLLQFLEKKGIVTTTNKGVRSISKSDYTVLDDYLIIDYFKSFWIEINNYYSGLTYPCLLQYLHHLIHISCVMTLAHRHRSSCVKLFKERGRLLTCKNKETGNYVFFPYRNSWSLKTRRWLYGKQFIDPFKIIANKRL